jgi:UDP-N-acetylmuramate--alanine ligase
MSAIAQYLNSAGNKISGSDRQFTEGGENESRTALEKEGILCFAQGAGGLTDAVDVVVVSTAIEDSVPEVQEAKRLNKPIIKRSELLAQITETKKTIAVAGTSGKSTTTAMLFEILHEAGLKPSVIGGAGLTRLVKQGKIGNAYYGEGEWLIIEADESDGSVVQYHPEIGLLLNIDKDHQDLDELANLFTIFRNNSSQFIVNLGHPLTAKLSKGSIFDFDCSEGADAYMRSNRFHQKGTHVGFYVEDHHVVIHAPGRHNMENAMAAIAVAHSIGISWETCSKALSHYQGIYRRHQLYGKKNGVTLVDDFAHNPVKCAKSIEACQPFSKKLIAWFQPHGYGPTRFLRHDFVEEISKVLRPQDEIWMSEIYYAGGTATKDISAEDLINDLKAKGVQAFFVADRKELLTTIKPHFTSHCTVLLMGARDPSLGSFAEQIWERL